MLTDFRNGLMQLVGAMAERQAFSTLTSRKRQPHQEQPTSIYGKTGKRRARKSLVEIVRTLELAENAGHAEAVVRSSGSNWFFSQTKTKTTEAAATTAGAASERTSERFKTWLASASSRVRCGLYKSKTRDAFEDAASVSLCWDGISVTGLSVMTGIAFDIGRTVAAYMTPKAVCTLLFVFFVLQVFSVTKRFIHTKISKLANAFADR